MLFNPFRVIGGRSLSQHMWGESRVHHIRALHLCVSVLFGGLYIDEVMTHCQHHIPFQDSLVCTNIEHKRSSVEEAGILISSVNNSLKNQQGSA